MYQLDDNKGINIGNRNNNEIINHTIKSPRRFIIKVFNLKIIRITLAINLRKMMFLLLICYHSSQ